MARMERDAERREPEKRRAMRRGTRVKKNAAVIDAAGKMSYNKLL